MSPPSPPSKPGTGELLHTRKLRLRSANASSVCPASVSGVRIQTQSRLFPNLHCNSVLRSPSLGLFPTPASTIVLSTLGDFNPEEQNQPPPRVARYPGEGNSPEQPSSLNQADSRMSGLIQRDSERGRDLPLGHRFPLPSLCSFNLLQVQISSFKGFRRLGPPIQTAL